MVQAAMLFCFCAAILGFLIYALPQVRKPTGWFGRFIVWMMNHAHSGVTDWGLTHVDVETNSAILDVGCGGGRTIQKLAALAANGTVDGVDYASGSVSASRAKNRTLIEEGRVKIVQASVSQLPFREDSFDLITAVETQYYWPDPAQDMREVLRVLKPGGTFIVIAESYKQGAHNKSQRPVMALLGSTNLNVDEQRSLFSDAGFTDVRIFEEIKKGWICGVGRKAV